MTLTATVRNKSRSLLAADFCQNHKARFGSSGQQSSIIQFINIICIMLPITTWDLFRLRQYVHHSAQSNTTNRSLSQPYYQPSPPVPTPFTIDASIGDPDVSGQRMSWALVVQNSKNIIVFGVYPSRFLHHCLSDDCHAGAGLYSFFQAYNQACLSTSSCQDQLVTIDNSSTIWVYSLSTVGATTQLSIGNQPIIPQSQNINGFQVCIISYFA